jgi:hypothetical protein
MGEVNHFMRVSQFKDRVDSLLAQSLLDLSMTLAVLARIENNNFEIVAVRSNFRAAENHRRYPNRKIRAQPAPSALSGAAAGELYWGAHPG